ncbi:hypothetical protein [Halosolutus halophilus]|uniref:hypothetical protein n=1 Tax=Halosolutus halophilus TaxID=1552990 RepID=UPI0022351CE6|nr:hypothetical protein [Halosolutus halophilus]
MDRMSSTVGADDSAVDRVRIEQQNRVVGRLVVGLPGPPRVGSEVVDVVDPETILEERNPNEDGDRTQGA